MAKAQKHIQIKNLVKRFGKLHALQDINLEIDRGDYIVILGPTGAGKTTLLKIIAGLVKPTRGEIFKDGQSLTGKIPPEKRNMAYLPQTSDYSLFPYMTVWENTVFSPRMKGEKSENEISSLGDEILDLVNLLTRYDAFPNELSGGMKQRVALARAIAADADVFLLDEPLRALDARLRIRLRTEIRKLVSDLDKTTFHVTHDQDEAIAIADKVLILNEGRIVQFDEPEEIYEKPNSTFSAYFFGNTNLIPAQSSKMGSDSNIFYVGGSKIILRTDKCREFPISNHGEVILAVKAERIIVESAQKSISHDNSSENTYNGLIVQKYFLGRWVNLVINVDGFPENLNVKIPSSLLHKYDLGANVNLTIPSDAILCFNEPWDIIKKLEV